MNGPDDRYWFRPKRYGYGAGWPIAWQGWALLAAYLAVLLLCSWLVEWDRRIGAGAAILIGGCATAAVFFISAARTRGGWRWRWGDDD